MYKPEELYDQSVLPNKKLWAELTDAQRAPWERWAQGANESTFEGLVDNDYVHDFQALINTGYRLATNMVVIVDYNKIHNLWGGPDLSAEYKDKFLQLKLDALFHPYHEPETGDSGFSFVAGFDTLYRVTIPWEAIVQVIFTGPPKVPTEKTA